MDHAVSSRLWCILPATGSAADRLRLGRRPRATNPAQDRALHTPPPFEESLPVGILSALNAERYVAELLQPHSTPPHFWLSLALSCKTTTPDPMSHPTSGWRCSQTPCHAPLPAGTVARPHVTPHFWLSLALFCKTTTPDPMPHPTSNWRCSQIPCFPHF